MLLHIICDRITLVKRIAVAMSVHYKQAVLVPRLGGVKRECGKRGNPLGSIAKPQLPPQL